MKAVILIFSIGVAFFMGCSKSEDGIGHFYELTFTDSASAVVSDDSVHILLTQVPSSMKVKTVVPYEVREDSTLLDTVRLNLNVLYGSFSSTPTPVKEVTIRNDTLFLWYAGVQPLGGIAKRSGNRLAAQIEAEPVPPYYSVQKVIIRISPKKYVTFASTLWR